MRIRREGHVTFPHTLNSWDRPRRHLVCVLIRQQIVIHHGGEKEGLAHLGLQVQSSTSVRM